VLAAVSLACTDTTALAAEREPVHPSCTVPALVRYLQASFADANAGRAAALVARLDARRNRFRAWSPYLHVGIRPAPSRPSVHAIAQRHLIGRYAARRAAVGEVLTLTGVYVEGRQPGRAGMSIWYTRTAPDLGDGDAYPAQAKVDVYCRRGTFGVLSGGAAPRGTPDYDPVEECRLARGVRPLGTVDGVVTCGRTLYVRPEDRAVPARASGPRSG
jgi:hypothetical protein